MFDYERMRKKKIMLGTPFGGDPKFEYMKSLLDTGQALALEKIPLYFCFQVGASDLAYSRNAIAARFLQSDCTDLVWIDSDMGWTPEAVLRLLNSDKDFVCGAYRKKSNEVQLVSMWPQGVTDMTRGDDGLCEIASSGTGFMKTTRRVFERLMEAHPEAERQHDCVGDGYEKFWRFFQFSGDGVGEDSRFCQAWRALGESVWMDPEIALSHIGQHDYHWDAGAAGLL